MSADDAPPPADTLDRRTLMQGAGGAAVVATLAGGESLAAQPGLASQIVMMDANPLAEAIRKRDVSCVEVMRAYLDHIDAVNPSFNALVALQDRDGLMDQARRQDQQVAETGILGPLHGFPIAPKDLQPVKGIRSTSGSPLLKDFIPTQDSLVIARMRKAGAIFIGKTNTPEFGLGSHTYNPVYGATRNAYDPSKSAGGSSGGAAVSLALRMLPVADGSDYGGSLRNPAGWNNVYGFRTSYGVVPMAGEDVWNPTMGVAGPMARTVPDLVRLLSAQAGYSPHAPFSVAGGPEAYLEPLKADLKGKRVAWLGDFNGFTPYEPGVLEVCARALKDFESLGCVIEPASVAFPLESVWDAFIRLRAWQQGGAIARFYQDPVKRALLKPEAIWEIETGLKLSAFDITAASTVRTAWFNAFSRLFDKYDYVVLPTAQVFPFDVTQHWPREIAGVGMSTYHEWMKAVCLITMTGCPSLAAPAGFSEAGQPMGLQIVGPIHRELDCLKLAFAYDQATNWSSRAKPPALKRL